MPDIFLSYSRDDQATARRFAEGFEREGFRVWWDQTLRSGENYDQVTEAALREAKAVVVLWSKKSVDSRWVRAEAITADRAGTLVPTMIEPCNRPIMFELKHTAELAHWKGEANDPAWRSFLSDVRGFVQKGVPPVPALLKTSTPQSSQPSSRLPWLVAAVVLLLGGGVLWAYFGKDEEKAVASWLNRGAAPSPSVDNPLANAQFTQFTDFAGTEVNAGISPDGRFVAFVADRDGPFHIWLSQAGTRRFSDLTPGEDDQRSVGSARNVGFSADGSEVWIAGTPDGKTRLRMVPLMGGAPRPFLSERAISVSWSLDGTRLVYFTSDPGDPLFVADRTGGNARQIFKDRPGAHNHEPIWSKDGQWIYYVHFIQGGAGADMDLWRVPSSGGPPERLTEHHSQVGSPTPVDARTVLYVARAGDRSGPWLWALDVQRKITRRVSVGLEKYLAVAASADGRRLVATVASQTATLWSLPIGASVVDERGVKSYPLSTARALAPRFGGASLFFLSSGGTGDGLWRAQDGQAALEIWRGSDGALLEAPAVSQDGLRTAVVLRKQGKSHLMVVSADGAEQQSLAEGIDIQGTSAWSPDAKWIVTAGKDAQGPGLFKIPVDGSVPVRLLAGEAVNPVWSPDGNLIVYGGPRVAAQTPLRAVRPDGTSVSLPAIQVPGDAAAFRFLPKGNGLVYMQGLTAPDFWLLDLTTYKTRQLTRLSNPATVQSFDITPDSKQIVFDRVRDNSDIVLIDLPK